MRMRPGPSGDIDQREEVARSESPADACTRRGYHIYSIFHINFQFCRVFQRQSGIVGRIYRVIERAVNFLTVSLQFTKYK